MPKANRSKQIDEILFQVEACYPQEFDPAMLDLWHQSLSDYEVKDISQAFSMHVKRSKYLPLISDIITILDDGLVSIAARAHDQWRLVMEAVRRNGLGRQPFFEDPITADLITRQFGWQYMCDIKEDAIKWELTRWTEAYQLAVETTGQPPRLTGPGRVARLTAPIRYSGDQKGTP